MGWRAPAIVAAVERVGESITFSAATVIAALLSLLFATFEFYSDLGIPLAIGIAVMDGSIAQWTRIQQVVGIAVAVALCWLISTTRAAAA